MPAKDLYHDAVKTALTKDGWTITHDPFSVKWGSAQIYIDLGAEKILGAEKEGRKILVEVKTFLGHSLILDLRNALGQFIFYHDIVKEREPDWDLYLAVPKKIFSNVFEEPFGALMIKNRRVQLIVFDKDNEEILQWIP